LRVPQLWEGRISCCGMVWHPHINPSHWPLWWRDGNHSGFTQRMWQNLLNNMAHIHLSLSQRPLTAMHVYHRT
jgi:hypothetical protein